VAVPVLEGLGCAPEQARLGKHRIYIHPRRRGEVVVVVWKRRLGEAIALHGWNPGIPQHRGRVAHRGPYQSQRRSRLVVDIETEQSADIVTCRGQSLLAGRLGRLSYVGTHLPGPSSHHAVNATDHPGG
jgi:hypothetical protein